MALTNAEVDAAIPVGGTPSRTLTNAAVKQLILDLNAAADAKVADNLTSSATVAPSKDAVIGGLATKAPYNAVRDETGTSFTLSAANHANRATYAANAAAIAVTWDTGHGMTKGDIGRIYQTAAGRVTVAAGTGTMTLSPGIPAARTRSVGDWIDFEYMGSDALKIVDVHTEKSSYYTARTNYGFFVPLGLGLTATSTVGVGTATALDSATTAASTTADGSDPYKYRRRVRYQSAAAAINRVAGFYNSGTLIRLDSTEQLRWPVRIIASIADAITSCTFALGLSRSVPPAFTTTEPSAHTESIYLAADTTDTNMQMMHNDSSGTATKIDLGASFPVGAWKMYELVLWFDGTDWEYEVTNLETSAFATGKITTNKPATNVAYSPFVARSSMANASTVAIEINGIWVGKP